MWFYWVIFYYYLFYFDSEVRTSWLNCWVLKKQSRSTIPQMKKTPLFHLNKDRCRYLTETPNFLWTQLKQHLVINKANADGIRSQLKIVLLKSIFVLIPAVKCDADIFQVSAYFDFLDFWDFLCTPQRWNTSKTRYFLWQRDWREVIKQDWLFFFKGHQVTRSCTQQLPILVAPG